MDRSDKWFIICPNCNREVKYTSNRIWNREKRKNRKYCSSCRKEWFIKNHPTRGKGLPKLQGEEYKKFKIDLMNWSRKVKDNCNWTCQKCGSRENLHSHHLIPKALMPEYTLCLANGIALCSPCHKELHKIIGKPRLKIEEREQ